MENKAQDDDLVMNLVELALGQPEQDRHAYLQRACAGESELFEQAWEYVQWECRMQGFLLEPLYSPPSLNEHPFEPGELLDGRFRILREIAQGGMGVVYEAMDERLERRIAIKCAKTGFRKRLPPEVRHAREITHPNVCKIFEIHTARTPSGEIDFVTMEYLEGETLADRLKRGLLPEAEARTIARQLCSGLAEAHSQGVIHGDLKSNNVILTKVADGSTRSVITDFGMARATETAQSTMQSGPCGGTPDYMAPELMQGEKASVASDIYALGVMLHELVSGRKPAAGAIAVHPKWNAIVAKCLAADPKHRYATATQIAQAFEPPRTRRWFLLAAAAVLVATITGEVTYQRATAPKEGVRLAMLPLTSSADLAPVAAGVFRDASANLAKIRGGSKARYASVPLEEIQRAKVETPEQAKAVFGATHVLHGTLTPEHDRVVLHVFLTDTRTGVNTKEWRMDYASGQMRYIPVALAGFATGALHLPTLASPPMNAAAERDYQAGSMLLRRDSTVDAALSAFERAQAADQDSALVWAGLAEAEWLKYGLTRGSDWLARATESTKEAMRRDPDLPRVLYVTGTLDFVNSLYELAAAEYQRALELEPNYSDVHRFLGRVYALSGQPELALAAYRNAVQNDPGNYRGYVFLGWFYNDMDQFSQAVAPLRQAVALAPEEPDARDQLGFAYKSLGRFQAAEAELGTALKFGETVFVLDQMGETLMYARQEQEAIPFFKRALTIEQNDLVALLDLGICYRRLNRRQESDQTNRDGLQAAEAAKRLNPRDGNARAHLAYFHSQLRQRQEAESEISQALTFSPDGVGVRWVAALTYEALAKRDATLSLLTSASRELSADLNRWPDLAGLQSDPRFTQLLISDHVQ